jgi:hypothetical protein
MNLIEIAAFSALRVADLEELCDLQNVGRYISVPPMSDYEFPLDQVVFIASVGMMRELGVNDHQIDGVAPALMDAIRTGKHVFHAPCGWFQHVAYTEVIIELDRLTMRLQPPGVMLHYGPEDKYEEVSVD